MHRFRVLWIVLLVLMVGRPASPAAAAPICFPDQPTAPACFAEPFASYWANNGGLPVFGYPLDNAREERNPDLKTMLQTQWTERNRLEVHPENRPPFEILLGRMGAERLSQLGRDPAQEGREAGPRAGCMWFEETGHNVCDLQPGKGFKTYWQTHGLAIPGLDAYGRSLQLFGLPLTMPRMETNAAGNTVLTQWFERARFEWHPQNPDEYTVLLGLLGSELRINPAAQRPPAIFGVEINRGAVAAVADGAADARVSWVRYHAGLWSEVEPVRGARDWSNEANVEAELRTLTARGMTPIVIVHGTPGWARLVSTSTCGPIKADALAAFATFMHDLVARYSRPPYNIRYWELGNGPDVDPGLVPADMPFGCWGDETDAYYGGSRYATLLKQVYPAVKRADPNAQVLLGGLLLDCDPENPPSGETCQPSRFLEGILRNGGGAFFDIIGYHAYGYWAPEQKDYDLECPNWRRRGGALLGKLAFLQSVQARYGVHKPIMMNEGGLLCYPGGTTCPGDAFFAAQANHAVRMYARAWSAGLLGASWYTLDGPGWREGGMLDQAQAPRPAYAALRFVATLLTDAVYAGPRSQGDIEGYAFRRGATTYQILWTNNNAIRTVPAPAGLGSIYNLAGQSLAPNGTNLQVGFEPIIVESRAP